MNRLNLILPKKGSPNWANAINNNFAMLAEIYNNLSADVKNIQAQLQHGEIIDLQAEKFVYLFGTSAKKYDIADWSDPDPSGGEDFDPNSQEYNNGAAFVVKTENSQPISYAGSTFVTNDILYIEKITNITTVSRWGSSLGGYYRPTTVQFHNDGRLLLSYEKESPMMLISEHEIDVEGSADASGVVIDFLHIAVEQNSLINYDCELSYNSTYIYDVQIYQNDGTRIYIGYSVKNNNGKVRIHFNTGVPSGHYINIAVCKTVSNG